MATRPPIPADIRRRVLVEAGHRCAIPACRHIEVDVHHIVPWAKCKTHEYKNLIALCPNCHRLAGRGKIDRKSLRLYKVNLRFSHDKFSRLEVDVLFEALKAPKGLQWPPFNLILLKRIFDAEFIEVHKPRSGVRVMGMDLTPHQVKLTEKGKAFLESLGVTEL